MTPEISFGLNLALVGLAIVFVVLSVTAIVVTLMQRVDQRWQERERRLRESAPDATPTIDNTTAVLIAAAVATYLGGRVRIRSVRRLMRTDLQETPWSRQGRAVLQGSHVISRRGGR